MFSLPKVYEIIEYLCKQNQISIAGMCREIGMRQSIITDLKHGRTKSLSAANMSKIANYFHVSTDALVEGISEGAMSNRDGAPSAAGVRCLFPDIPPAPSVPGSRWIPVLGRVAAGVPIEAVTDIEDYEEISPEMAAGGEYFALRIQGDSMEPKISSGDVVIVRRQDDAESGEIAVVSVNGDEATVKRIKKRPEGLLLISSNPAFEPMFYSVRQVEELPVRIIGKVVELRAKF